MPVSRRCRLRTIFGSKLESVSRGTSISTGPISVSTVFDLVPPEGVAAAATGRVVLLVAEVLGHLRIQCGFEHVLRQLPEQSVRAHQLDALLFGLGQQLLRQLQLVHLVRHGLQCFRHGRSFPPSSLLGVSGQPGSTVIH